MTDNKGAAARFEFIGHALRGDGPFRPEVVEYAIDGSVTLSGRSYLTRYPRESDAKFARRNLVAFYDSPLDQACSRFIGYLSTKPPSRELPHDLYESMAEDIDGKGNSLDVFWQQFATEAKARGSMLLLVDMPAASTARSLSEQIAAIASVSGTMTQGTLAGSSPVHPTPFLQIHGTSDPLVPYGGNPLYLSVEEVLDYWIGYNQCDTTPLVTQLADLDATDGSTVEHIVYDNGDQGVTVEHMKISGGGHTWPGGTDGRPGTNRDIHASEEIWKFFSRYDINGLMNATVGLESFDNQLSSTFTRVYPNPFSTQTTISFTLDQPGHVSLSVYDMIGRLIETLVDEPKAPGEHILIWDGTDSQGNAMPAGTYFYRMETAHFREAKSMILLR